MWITDGALEYNRATSGTTRSYPSPLDIMHIHQFRCKHNKYGFRNRTQYILITKPYLTLKYH
ncbi:hypothetical protein Hanom_Chr12g01138951 [Helianthus anomalus]